MYVDLSYLVGEQTGIFYWWVGEWEELSLFIPV